MTNIFFLWLQHAAFIFYRTPLGKGGRKHMRDKLFLKLTTTTKILNLCLIKKGIVEVDDSLLSLKAEN